MSKHRIKEKGFTLVELSIALVIIGLLIGGILVGQSMIQTANTHTIIRTMQQYQIAIGQFYNVYKNYPGDAPVTLGTCSAGNGNNYTGMAGSSPDWYEMYSAFGALAAAGMTSNGFTCTGVQWNLPSSAVPGVNIPALPDKGAFTMTSATTNGGHPLSGPFIGVVAFPYCHYALLAGRATGFYGYSNSYLTPSAALAIDQKIDDGNAITGYVLNGNGSGVSGGATGCIDNADFDTTDRPTRKLNINYSGQVCITYFCLNPDVVETR